VTAISSPLERLGDAFPEQTAKSKYVVMFSKLHIHVFLKLSERSYSGGPGSSIGIATDYGLDGPDQIPVGTRFSARPDRPVTHPASCKMGTGSFPGVKCGRGVLLC